MFVLLLILIIIALGIYILAIKRANKKNTENRIRILLLVMDLLDFQINKIKQKECGLEEQEDIDDKLIGILDGVSILAERMCSDKVPEKIERFGVDDWFLYSSFKHFKES